jgi:putative transposase
VVVGIFPNRAAVLRLFGARLAEQTDEWLVGHRYFSLGSMATLLAPGEEPGKEVGETTVTAA